MKCQIPEISWHNRDPVFSVDFQPKIDEKLRLASAGADSHVLIWYVDNETGSVNLELAADLTKHTKSVNCVRWSPSGEILASSDDDNVIITWNKKDSTEVNMFDRDDIAEGDKEIWVVYKILRGHMEDVYDLSWSLDSQFIVSGSVDNKAIVWDVHKQKNIAMYEHKGFVQGVAYDPLNKFIATLSTDRHFHVFDIQTKKNVQRISKAVLPLAENHPMYGKSSRLFHDDTMQTFYRRLTFSPDGNLIVAPAGVFEIENSVAKPINTTYIFTRQNMKQPSVVLPSPGQFTVCARFCPLLFQLRESTAKPLFNLPYRMIYAVATKSSVYLYDTQQRIPFGMVSNIHYTRLTDLAWSHDGAFLFVSSTDGFCSIIQFAEGELGKEYKDTTIREIIDVQAMKSEQKKKKKKSGKKKGGEAGDDQKENGNAETAENDEPMEAVDDDVPVVLSTLPVEIVEKIPIDKIIKSNEIFSPEKQVEKPVTPIQVRKYPRNLDDGKSTPTKDESAQPSETVKTPKNSHFNFHSKTPTPIEVRRFPRVLQPTSAQKKTSVEYDDWPTPVIDDSPSSSQDSLKEIKEIKTTPQQNKTPRRIEFQTISTPKSKKKLLGNEVF